jgi:hypothetical protein
LESLSAILAAEQFRKLRAVDVGQTTYQGQVIWVIVPRPEETQAFFLVGREGMPKQDPKPLPQSIKPLIEWIGETRKQIDKRKTFLIKGANPVNCWLPRSWPTARPSLQAQGQNAGRTINEETHSEAASIPANSETNDQQINRTWEPLTKRSCTRVP